MFVKRKRSGESKKIILRHGGGLLYHILGHREPTLHIPFKDKVMKRDLDHLKSSSQFSHVFASGDTRATCQENLSLSICFEELCTRSSQDNLPVKQLLPSGK